jgi:hypothetical protein
VDLYRYKNQGNVLELMDDALLTMHQRIFERHMGEFHLVWYIILCNYLIEGIGVYLSPVVLGCSSKSDLVEGITIPYSIPYFNY